MTTTFVFWYYQHECTNTIHARKGGKDYVSDKSEGILSLGENITVIVITGGPCSGKTTAVSMLTQTLSDRGYKVLVSPESATKLILAGMSPQELSPLEFQKQILLDILAQEDRIFSIAKRMRDNGRKVVVLCDRGTMDGEAYIAKDEFSEMIGGLGYTRRELCDGRYHAVIHLRTTALGAERYYTLANNPARSETPEHAIMLDESTLTAWLCHQHPRVIDNSTDFTGKMDRLLAEVCAILGDPVPLEKEDKFLISPISPDDLPVSFSQSLIRQDYLVSPMRGVERRVRARSNHLSVSYYYTEKESVEDGVRIERERMISEREYLLLRSSRDPDMATIEKQRICFFWKERFFEIDLFASPRGLALMEIERLDRDTKIVLPPFVSVIRDVTRDKRYSNKQIARAAAW